LIRLSPHFAIEPYIQTVGVPTISRSDQIGTLASYNSQAVQPGQVEVYRGPIPEGSGPSFTITGQSEMLEIGDSGSGLIALENGRAIVRGIASFLPFPHDVVFADVFADRDWIFATLGMSDDLLAGFTRVHWSGRATGGSMVLGCPNFYSTMTGPVYVEGASVGAVCEAGKDQTVICTLGRDLGDRTLPIPLAITGFTMRTDCPPHGVSVQELPHSQSSAVFFGKAASNPDPAGICIREFICHFGGLFDNGPVMGPVIRP
jgi:hypothetical protein